MSIGNPGGGGGPPPQGVGFEQHGAHGTPEGHPLQGPCIKRIRLKIIEAIFIFVIKD
ncbi:hypothetical protein [Winogradskyella jejuensis]|uniref:Uncharacterized protein n=1 Tax=Winogradskyella jejuensis TaxID=1089305 RepID=A0A1M5N221_9FLAO|nr:hypothetical protein [Winogradskyella jejuensis]SHG83239.1 hypothetical protein SAMN05444148_1055 [Winogradskyella jejuensis]